MTGLIAPGLDGFLTFGLLGGPPVILPGDLIDAVEAYLEALLVAPGTLTFAGAGKLPPGRSLPAMPYAIVGDPDEEADYQEDGSGHAPYDDHGQLPIRVIASTRSAAKAISKTIAGKYPAGLNDAPLAFDDGTLLQLRRINRGAPVLEDEPAPLGQQVWIAHLTFAAITSKIL